MIITRFGLESILPGLDQGHLLNTTNNNFIVTIISKTCIKRIVKIYTVGFFNIYYYIYPTIFECKMEIYIFYKYRLIKLRKTRVKKKHFVK